MEKSLQQILNCICDWLFSKRVTSIEYKWRRTSFFCRKGCNRVVSKESRVQRQVKWGLYAFKKHEHFAQVRWNEKEHERWPRRQNENSARVWGCKVVEWVWESLLFHPDRGLPVWALSIYLPTWVPVHTAWLRKQPQHGGGTMSPPQRSSPYSGWNWICLSLLSCVIFPFSTI